MSKCVSYAGILEKRKLAPQKLDLNKIKPKGLKLTQNKVDYQRKIWVFQCKDACSSKLYFITMENIIHFPNQREQKRPKVTDRNFWYSGRGSSKPLAISREYLI